MGPLCEGSKRDMPLFDSFKRGGDAFLPGKTILRLAITWCGLAVTAGFLVIAGAADLVSVGTPSPSPAVGNGSSTAPKVSADGRFVLFTSSANDLVPGDNGYLGLDVFLR